MSLKADRPTIKLHKADCSIIAETQRVFLNSTKALWHVEVAGVIFFVFVSHDSS